MNEATQPVPCATPVLAGTIPVPLDAGGRYKVEAIVFRVDRMKPRMESVEIETVVVGNQVISRPVRVSTGLDGSEAARSVLLLLNGKGDKMLSPYQLWRWGDSDKENRALITIAPYPRRRRTGDYLLLRFGDSSATFYRDIGMRWKSLLRRYLQSKLESSI